MSRDRWALVAVCAVGIAAAASLMGCATQRDFDRDRRARFEDNATVNRAFGTIGESFRAMTGQFNILTARVKTLEDKCGDPFDKMLDDADEKAIADLCKAGKLTGEACEP